MTLDKITSGLIQSQLSACAPCVNLHKRKTLAFHPAVCLESDPDISEAMRVLGLGVNNCFLVALSRQVQLMALGSQ